MSRAPARNGTTVPRRPGDEDEICPVCKSSRYLNPNMRFLVNPECYHKMCESCVDRIFSQGPAPCPVAGCARTLRKQRFRKQTFDDINIEREVDIRRRVAQACNRRRSEFESLLAFNNYLEEVETITSNLCNNVDVAETEAMLASHAAQNAAAISRNAALSKRESAAVAADQNARREAARLGREAARREEEDEKREREQDRRDLVEAIGNSRGDADVAARVQLKKSTARRTAAEKAARLAATAAGGGGGDLFSSHNGSAPPAAASVLPEHIIKGLKPVTEPEPERPYDPFGGLVPLARQPPQYHVLRDAYEHPWLDRARSDPVILAGGYDLREYYARAMVEAFAGLGCFVGMEKVEAAGSEKAVAAAVGTAGAAEAAGGGE
ncbi:TFIIH/NER complex subunit [Pseudocyphellaria aurata]|nr:TFIIH/NER complex subunit [Pseudocyphellaria aurata]